MKAILQALERLARTEAVELWAVGGMVRDTLLGRTPPDADLVLRGAMPFARRAARVLRGAFVPLDDDRDTARVVIKRGRPEPVELDFAELQGRTLEEDLAGRDFTINAIACPLAEFLRGGERALTDPFRGAEDLQAGRIRVVSPEAFQADPLRTLRAYRFMAQLGFTIETGTRSLIREAAAGLKEVSAERITAELFKLLSAPRCAEHFRELAQERTLAAVLPEAPWEKLASATAALAHLEDWLAQPEKYLPDARPVIEWLGRTDWHRPMLKWAALWDGLIDEPILSALANRLRLSREQRRLWRTLALFRRAPREVLLRQLEGATGNSIRAILGQYFRQTGTAGWGGLLIQWAHLRGDYQGPETDALTAGVVSALHLYQQELEPILRRPRILTGRDLQREFHLRPGPPFKALLGALLQAELMGQVTTREEALEFVRRRLRGGESETVREP